MEIKVAKWGKPKNILKNMNIIITIETNIPTKNQIKLTFKKTYQSLTISNKLRYLKLTTQLKGFKRSYFVICLLSGKDGKSKFIKNCLLSLWQEDNSFLFNYFFFHQLQMT